MSFQSTVAVLDMDGFYVNKKFVARELGIALLRWPFTIFHQAYDLSSVQLTKEDYKTVHATRMKCHGLPFLPLKYEKARPLSALKGFVATVYGQFNKGFDYVAYKGGTIERDLLRDLGIPGFDLELMGCPKFKELRPVFGKQYEECGAHDSSQQKHCSRVESAVFRDWIIHEFLE